MKAHYLIFIIIALYITSCASVKFYDNKDVRKANETGIKFYSPKPYLLVEKNPSKDVSSKSTIIYLPDFDSPTYVKLRPGLGSTDLKLSLERGILTSYGITTDTKIPETITAIGGLLGDAVSSFETFKEETDVKDNGDKTAFIKEDATKEAKSIINGVIKGIGDEKSMDSLNKITIRNYKVIMDECVKTLEGINKMIATDIQVKDLDQIIKILDNGIKTLEYLKTSSTSEDAQNYNGRIDGHKKELLRAKGKIAPPAKPDSSIILYEIIIDSKGTRLKQVNLISE